MFENRGFMKSNHITLLAILHLITDDAWSNIVTIIEKRDGSFAVFAFSLALFGLINNSWGVW